MANIAKMKRERMLAFLEELKAVHSDDASIRALNEIENHIREKKYGLIWEDHTEAVDEMLDEYIPVLCEDQERRLCRDPLLPWNFIIEGDNLQALYLLEKTHHGKVDCIYIDPPYNSGAKDWKYNNDYVDGNDSYRHSKWLSMMRARLQIAKHLLNPHDSVLICTIDEKEYLRLGCLLEELFPDARIQMIDTLTNPKGVARDGFSRSDEYIYFVMLGTASPERLHLGDDWSPSATKSSLRDDVSVEDKETEPEWTSMMRRGSNSSRSDRPGLYYAIFVDPTTKSIKHIGSALPAGVDRDEDIPGLIQVLPLRASGAQGRWQVGPDELRNRIDQGRVRLGRETKYGYVINYLPDSAYQKVLSGAYTIKGRAEDGSLVAYKNMLSNDNLRVAPTQWKIASHNASEHGSTLLGEILLDRKFPFPKSLYAVYDTIRFFVSSKPNAVILDFFAGSGTTMHAVNLINATDNGQRRCIMVTNNEVSDAEEKQLRKLGYSKDDPEWSMLGIARYVTWPRTACSIQGCNINGEVLTGNYGVEAEVYVKETDAKHRGLYRRKKIEMYPILARIKKGNGFASNVKYLACGWTPRKPEDYLLSNALCLHIREMIELQTGYELDGVKNVLILNRDDFKKAVLTPDAYEKLENIWVNQNMIFSAEEMRLLAAKEFKYIPREFFGRELREAAE